ncbi:MAG: hypothetical protein RRB13_02230 [bacterium]|nr:hypothetical protein [bacterium]
MNERQERAKFHLQRLLNLQVLGHSHSFEGFNLDEALKDLESWQEQAMGNLSALMADLKDQRPENRLKLIFEEVGGQIQALSPSLPLSLVKLYQREVARLDPKLYLTILQNLVAVDYLTPLLGAGDPMVKALTEGKMLAAIDWFPAALGSLEVTLLARRDTQGYWLTGRKNSLFGQDADLNLPRIYLVLAELAEEGRDRTALFLSDGKGAQLVQDPLLYGPGTAHVDFADRAPARFLEYVEDGVDSQLFVKARMQLLLLQSCLASKAYKTALAFGQSRLIQDMSEDEREVALLYHPLAGDILMELKAFREGMTGALLQTAFYHDCLKEATGEAQAEYEDLLELFLLVFKVYAGRHVPNMLHKALQLTGGAQLDLLGPLELSTVAGLVGGSDLDLALQLVTKVLKRNEGRAFKSLFREFERFGDSEAKSDGLKEAVMIFRDFAGGLFLLVNDLLDPEEGKNPQADIVNCGAIADLFGDVMLCFLLIRQAFEAERILSEMGANFYNLGPDAIARPELRPYYNLLVLVERFSVQHLSRQEGQIRIIQRNLAPAMDAILEKEGKL